MTECYLHWCEHHEKEEPFCRLDQCVASPEDLEAWVARRRSWLQGKLFTVRVVADPPTKG